jgi:hypothetical protein
MVNRALTKLKINISDNPARLFCASRKKKFYQMPFVYLISTIVDSRFEILI